LLLYVVYNIPSAAGITYTFCIGSDANVYYCVLECEHAIWQTNKIHELSKTRIGRENHPYPLQFVSGVWKKKKKRNVVQHSLLFAVCAVGVLGRDA
jgi:hypothetical protein